MIRSYTFPIFLIVLLPLVSLAQVSQVEFGKNRVQFHQDFEEWLQYESDNFVTYWYGEGRNIGQAAVQIAEYDFAYIQRMLEHRMNEKVQLIVYTDLTDVKQSNIGSEEVFSGRAGQTKIIGNKVFVYFNGDHNDLRRQIREGVASVYLETMLFGSNLQEVVQNLVLMNLPEWFKQGLVAYIGQSWNTDLDGQLRHLVLSEEYDSFEKLALDHPRLAGQSMWQYISETYGEATVSNLLYLTRINRSVESGFLYVLGSPYEAVLREWELFFRNRYQTDLKTRQAPKGQPLVFKNKRQLPITNISISPDGQRIAYVLNEIGKQKVYLHNLQDGKRSVIFSTGNRNPIQATDYSYPLLAWNPTGAELSILYEKRDRPKMLRYDLFTKKSSTTDLATEYHRVYSMDYVNPSTMVFSATVRGFSDIFLYFPASRQSQRITTDFYDDLDARFVRVRNRPGILFASNRADTLLRPMKMDTILPLGTFDIFYYDLESKTRELVRVTNTPLADERQPMAIDTTHFSYLSNKSGIYNREAGYLEDFIHHYEQEIRLTDGSEIILHIDSTLEKLDSSLIDTVLVYPVMRERAIVYPTGNYVNNIKWQISAPRVNRFVEVIREPAGDAIYLQGFNLDTVIQPNLTQYQKTRHILAGIPVILTRPVTEATSKPIEEESITKKEPGKNITTENVPEEFTFQTRFNKDLDLEKPQAEEPAVTVEENPEEAPDGEYSFEDPRFEPIPQDQTDSQGQPLPVIEDVPTVAAAPRQETSKVYKFRPGRITSYRLRFRTDFVTTTFDNSPLFGGLEPFGVNQADFDAQQLGLLIKGNFKDLFEDHVFEGGVRVPTTLNGTEYFLYYENKKKRLDKRFAFYRKNHRFEAESVTFVPWRVENNTILGQFQLRYPLDVFRSIRAITTLRRDRVQTLATDQFALAQPVSNEQQAGIQLEYVFDNTLQKSLNILNGTRYKFFVGMYKNFDLDFNNGLSLTLDDGFTGVVGIDARHYERLDRLSILAIRFAGAHSFGSQKLLYYLGGTDNWLLPKFNQSIAPPDEPFIYESLALNLRGFDQNIRNGNTYVLINTEIRIPIFQYFSRRIRSPFFRNFQLVGFFDAGTAWAGSDPFSEENPLNTSTFSNPRVDVQVTFFRDPVVVGYGVGARATIFGYMLRADYAWGYETRRTQEPKLHLSLGLDF